ncbi:MAG: hypothetical protein JST26_13405 [Bacteroidetes bacterium]|nr:hypothetical protein [Bacteroidota bacterium]
MQKLFSTIAAFCLTLVSVFGQSKPHAQKYISIDPYTPKAIKALKLKSYRIYKDTSLLYSYSFDTRGRIIESRWFDGMGRHLDSSFYWSGHITINRIYSHNNEVNIYFKQFKTKKHYTSETYQWNSKNSNFEKTSGWELRFKKGKKVYHKTTENGKVTYIEEIKYRHGKFLCSTQIYYNYLKDSLVNMTLLRNHKDSTVRVQHTHEKYARVLVDTVSRDTSFYYSDENSAAITYNEKGRPIVQVSFDDSGNINGTNNFIYLNDKTVKKICRIYDTIQKNYQETIHILHYNDFGFLVQLNNSEFYKYEFYR